MACNLTKSDIDTIVLDYYEEETGNTNLTLDDTFEGLGINADTLRTDLKPLKARVRKKSSSCKVSKNLTPSEFAESASLDEASQALTDNLEENKKK